MTVSDLERSAATLDLRIDGVHLTPLGLEITGDLSFDDFEALGWMLGKLRDLTAFALGDWLVFGEHTYGEKYAQAIEATGRSKQTLKNYHWVAYSVPRSYRRPGLSWSHHMMVAKLDRPEQVRWLDVAESEALSVEEFSGRMKERLLTDDPVPTEPEASSPSAIPSPPSLNVGTSEAPGGADGGTASPVPIQPGHGVAGIDFDTYKATIAVIDFDATVCDVREVRFRKNTQSGTVEAYEAVKRLPRLLWDGFDWSAVGVAWVERGYGKGRNADWALGRVQGAITATLAGSFPVNEIAIQEWRKELTGMGQKPKHEMLVLQRKALADAGVTIRQGPEREPVSPSFAGLTDDELDAVSIAVVGREQNVRALAGAAS